jgi:peptidoglycan/xylan/chitin deacetylase (PgdA/CDA1 family)
MPATSHLDAGAVRRNRWTKRELAAQTLSWTGGLGVLRHISRRRELDPSSGASTIFRPVSQSKYLILCYHRVGTEGIPYYCTLPVPQFEMQMRYLRKHYRVLSMANLAAEIKKPPAKPTQAVAVTFDDGYSDLYRFALPILKKYEIPATIYLITDCIESGHVAWYDRIFLALLVAAGPAVELPLLGGLRFPLGSPEQRIETGATIVSILRNTPVPKRKEVCAALDKQVKLPAEPLAGRMLCWQQILEMRAAGISFGAHTLSHPALGQLPPSEVQRELLESKSILEEKLGEPVLDFAFPFGRPEDCGPFAYEAAARCGYRSAVTTSWGYNTPEANMHALRRVQLGDEQTSASFGLQLCRSFLAASESAPLTAPAASRPAGSEATVASSTALAERSSNA